MSIKQRDPKIKKPSKAQLAALHLARHKYSDGRVPAWVFNDYRSIISLLNGGFIEYWKDYGAPMYRLTHRGLDVLEIKPKNAEVIHRAE